MRNPISSIQKGDVVGGLSAAIITLPMSIAYGVAAFAALGPEFRPHAALFGLNAAIIAGLFAALFGGTPTQISGPKAPLTLIITTVVASLAIDPLLLGFPLDHNWIVVGLASACVIIGGITQIVFGAVGLGNLVKYIPYPVVAGFMNGIAILLIWNQLPPFLGLGKGVDVFSALSTFTSKNGISLLIGACTLISIYLSKRHLRRAPAFLIGLITGSALFFVFSAMIGPSLNVAAIGNLRMVLPSPTAFSELFHLPFNAIPGAWMLKIIIYGIVLGVIGSMESLMSSVAIDNIRGTRHNSKSELLGQGIGNIIASFFGSLFAAGSIPRSIANIKAGGRNKVSGAFCSLLILLIFVSLAPVIGKIPLSVFAAMVIYVGITLFDRPTLRLFKALQTPGEVRRDVFAILLVNIGVAVITVSVNLVWAVTIGLAISTVYFIIKTGISIIRREYTADLICSNKIRSRQQIAHLNKNKNKIKVFELHGPIFFGSADRLAQILETKMKGAIYCVLDMKQITEIDSTGANILVRLHKMFEKQNKFLVISHIRTNHTLWNFLEISGVKQEILDDRFYLSTDLALEWAEDQLLDQICEGDTCSHYELGDLDVFEDFSDDELKKIEALLEKDTLKKDEIIIKEGDTDRDLFILTRGSVSVKMNLPFTSAERRLFTFDAGVVFGEMALLDGKPRSANVQAEEDCEVYRLSFSNFGNLLDQQPQIAAKLLKNIALVLSDRLRARSNELRMMVDY
jgi:SulP family sulfate permease